MNQKSDVSDPVSCASEVSAIEIDEVQRGWSLRGRGRDMVFGVATIVLCERRGNVFIFDL